MATRTASDAGLDNTAKREHDGERAVTRRSCSLATEAWEVIHHNVESPYDRAKILLVCPGLVRTNAFNPVLDRVKYNVKRIQQTIKVARYDLAYTRAMEAVHKEFPRGRFLPSRTTCGPYDLYIGMSGEAMYRGTLTDDRLQGMFDKQIDLLQKYIGLCEAILCGMLIDIQGPDRHVGRRYSMDATYAMQERMLLLEGFWERDQPIYPVLGRIHSAVRGKMSWDHGFSVEVAFGCLWFDFAKYSDEHPDRLAYSGYVLSDGSEFMREADFVMPILD